MKYIKIIFSLFTLLLFSQCTPKIAKAPQSDQQPDKEQVVDKANDFRSRAPAAGPAPQIQLGSYEHFTLPNGLKVIMVENSKLPRVSLQLFVDVPVVNEREYAGYIGIAGEMLNKGTKNRSKAEIDEAVDFLGASLSTSPNGIYASSLTKHLDPLLEIMTDILYNPSFPQAEFDKIKKQNLSALAQAKEDPNAIASNVAQVLRYGSSHPYGEISTEESIDRIDLARCKKYYETYFKPNISYLVVVGDVSLDDIKPRVHKHFGKWAKSANISKKSHTMPLPPDQTQVDFVSKSDAVQSVINVTYPINLKPGSADVIPARVMNTMLGGFFNSRLMQNLRETHGFTYGARSSLSSDELVGSFNAGAAVRNEVTDSSIVQIMKELNAIRSKKLSQSDLDLVKNVMAGSFARSLERPQTIARFALNTFRYNLPKDYYVSYLKRLSSVTADDVLAMARKYIRPDRAHIIVVGNKDEVVDKLGRFAASNNKVNYYDHYGNPIEMQELDLSGDVTAQSVIENYIHAIGGREQLKKVTDIRQTFIGEVQGMMINNDIFIKAPNKFAMNNSVNGTVMMSRVFDGTKGKDSGMGGDRMLEGAELDNMKVNARLFKEMYINELGMKAVLKGIESINGQNAYKVELGLPSGGGNMIVDYFSVDNGLKLRSEIIDNSSGQPVKQVIEWTDYKAVKGVKLPHSMAISGGGMPMTIKMTASSVKVNEGIPDSKFVIE